ncbi:MAG: glycoside hydrolase family 30 protein [Bacteroidia bacterium]
MIRFIFILLLIQISCKGKEILIPPSSNNPTDGTIAVWKTSNDGSILLYKQPVNIKFSTNITADVNINIDALQYRQTMDGFGAALTGSSAYVLMKNLNATQRNNILKDLFDPINGIGLSYLRLTIGASDFSLNNFTYNDISLDQKDTALTSFSIATEEEYVIPVLKEILAINPNVQIMASPWSAPAWMKLNKSLIKGGKLDPTFYTTYANYFVKYINAFASYGININAITIQNEPLYAAPYLSLEMSALEQADFIKIAIGPAFTKNNIQTKIIIYDHNWDRPDYPLTVLADSAARKYISGTAFHCYGGNVSAMSQVSAQYPDKGIYFTECSGGEWSKNFGSNLAWNTENLIIGSPRNDAKNVLFWNLALDENFGPRNGGCQDCRGVISVNSINNQIQKNVEYYLLGHASKFVQFNAKRIVTADTRSAGISQVAYINTDGSKVLLAYNYQTISQKIQINENGKSFNYSIEPGSLVTFKW